MTTHPLDAERIKLDPAALSAALLAHQKHQMDNRWGATPKSSMEAAITAYLVSAKGTEPVTDDEGHVWPPSLSIRDTTIYDDMGGGGQRIYTTAGRGYKKVEYVRADLASPLPAEPGVKPLEWSESTALNVAPSIFGPYQIWRHLTDPSPTLICPDSNERLAFGSLDEAKAAAQADYTARIRSALYTSPAEPLEVGDAMVERAAISLAGKGLNWPAWEDTARAALVAALTGTARSALEPTAAPVVPPVTHRPGAFETEHGRFETDEHVIYIDPNGKEWEGTIGEVQPDGEADFIGNDWSRGGTYKWRFFRKLDRATTKGEGA